MSKRSTFRVGRVRGDLRGRVWYLTYHEHGRRLRPRVGTDATAARQLAAQINAQLETHAPSALNFEPVSLADLQRAWLEHHEHVRRSSVRTIVRYRCATRHLVDFAATRPDLATTDRFRTVHAEEFVRHLRTLQVAPNGHPHATKRPLLDKGVRYILQTCRTLFGFAQRRRHLPPYAENPFAPLDLDRIPIENARPIVTLSADLESRFLAACDAWQFPLFATLLLTGLRPGELAHLLLPDDLDLEAAILRVRNKPDLGWQVKTRNERELPLVEPLVALLRRVVGTRTAGPVFRLRGCSQREPLLADATPARMLREIGRRVVEREAELQRPLTRTERLTVAGTVWRDAGALETDRLRREFLRITTSIGVSHLTAVKTLRHQFATSLQDANVDPLIRCELMGHSVGSGSHGLGTTAVYTHTRAETKRRQLEQALRQTPAYPAVEALVARREELAFDP